MKLTIESVGAFGASVVEAVGVDANGKRWRFAGDWRAMRTIAEAMVEGETVEVEVDDWQILGPA